MKLPELRERLEQYRQAGVISAAIVVEDTLIFAYPVADESEGWLLLAGDPLLRLEFSEDGELQYQAITLDTLEDHGDLRIIWPEEE